MNTSSFCTQLITMSFNGILRKFRKINSRFFYEQKLPFKSNFAIEVSMEYDKQTV